MTRDFAGASVCFNDFGQVIKVSLPADFSVACITGIEPGTAPEKLASILKTLGFKIPVENIRIPAQTASSPEAKAIIKMEDPLFSTKLSSTLQARGSSLSATTVPINSKSSNCRKVYISWHKSSRSVWLNFGVGETAKRVGQKFNSARYKVLGQNLTASDPKSSRSYSRGGSSRNPVAWTIVLSGVPSQAKRVDIENAITAPHDNPRHVEMGHAGYQASEAEVSVDVRSKLEEYGALENFFLAPFSKGKRAKAAAWFQDEGDAKSACSLNNKPLPILKGGRLTVTLIRSAKVKVLTAIYSALKHTIDQEARGWKEKCLVFRVYPGGQNQFTTLKIEGDDTEAVEKARKTLANILKGKVLTHSENPVWSPALNSYGTAFQTIKALERELKVVIIRDRTKRQLLYYGLPEKFDQTARQVTDILKHDISASFEIDLTPEQFSWVVTGGFKIIQQTLGKEIPVFNIVTRRVTINGTQQQYQTALAIINKRDTLWEPLSTELAPQGDCPICFCEAENPIHTSCKHTYCLECFEENCKAAASTSGAEFRIKCQGNEGICSSIFSMEELGALLSSSAFENILQASFEEYVKRHPESFHYCPTADCGYIYRCSKASNLKPHTCPNCFESICTTCHASHGKYTCAEYTDIASGGLEALARLKKELNIKDCPRCSTPMEKTDGCNHMTCIGCKAHICWVCMAVFETGGPCYDHMNQVHGGIGLGLERFID